jgi:hypothetical protein
VVLQPDRFDVVVVGARASGAQAVAALAAAIERRCGVPQAAFALGLDHGGVEVHRDVPKAEAIALARTLQELGAVVDVRAARHEPSSPFLLEPDAHANPCAPPPPEFMAVDDDSDLISLHALDAEPPRPPRPQRAPTGEVDGSRPQGQPLHVEPDRPFDGERKPRRASQSGTSPSPSAHDSQRIASVARETPARGVSRTRSEPARATPARATPPPAKAPPTHGSVKRTTTEVVSADDHGPLDPGAPVISTDALGGSTTPPRFAAPETGARVELDLAAVGLAQAPVGATALMRGRASSETSGVRGAAESSGTARVAVEGGAPRWRAAGEPVAGASGGGFPSPMEPAASISASRLPVARASSATLEHEPAPSVAEPAPAGLLANDRATSGLIGAVLATVIGLVLAYGWVRRDAIATAEKLEGELRQAVADPIGVDDGRARAPQVIADELATALDERRARQLQIWGLIALPLAIAFALLKRDSGSRTAADPRR